MSWQWDRRKDVDIRNVITVRDSIKAQNEMLSHNGKDTGLGSTPKNRATSHHLISYHVQVISLKATISQFSYYLVVV